MNRSGKVSNSNSLMFIQAFRAHLELRFSMRNAFHARFFVIFIAKCQLTDLANFVINFCLCILLATMAPLHCYVEWVFAKQTNTLVV